MPAYASGAQGLLASRKGYSHMPVVRNTVNAARGGSCCYSAVYDLSGRASEGRQDILCIWGWATERN